MPKLCIASTAETAVLTGGATAIHTAFAKAASFRAGSCVRALSVCRRGRTKTGQGTVSTTARGLLLRIPFEASGSGASAHADAAENKFGGGSGSEGTVSGTGIMGSSMMKDGDVHHEEFFPATRFHSLRTMPLHSVLARENDYRLAGIVSAASILCLGAPTHPATVLLQSRLSMWVTNYPLWASHTAFEATLARSEAFIADVVAATAALRDSRPLLRAASSSSSTGSSSNSGAGPAEPAHYRGFDANSPPEDALDVPVQLHLPYSPLKLPPASAFACHESAAVAVAELAAVLAPETSPYELTEPAELLELTAPLQPVFYAFPSSIIPTNSAGMGNSSSMGAHTSRSSYAHSHLPSGAPTGSTVIDRAVFYAAAEARFPGCVILGIGLPVPAVSTRATARRTAAAARLVRRYDRRLTRAHAALLKTPQGQQAVAAWEQSGGRGAAATAALRKLPAVDYAAVIADLENEYSDDSDSDMDDDNVDDTGDHRSRSETSKSARSLDSDADTDDEDGVDDSNDIVVDGGIIDASKQESAVTRKLAAKLAPHGWVRLCVHVHAFLNYFFQPLTRFISMHYPLYLTQRTFIFRV